MAENESAKTGNPWSIKFPWPMEKRVSEEAKRLSRSKQETVRWLIAYALDRIDNERDFTIFKYTGEDMDE